MMCFFIRVSVSVRTVLLFRPPRLNSKFEDSVVKYTETVSTSSLRTFIRDNVYVCKDAFPFTISVFPNLYLLSFPSRRFGLCPHLTTENKDSLREGNLLTAYYGVDYLRNPKGTNYWRNR